jgi:hypothetical protein
MCFCQVKTIEMSLFDLVNIFIIMTEAKYPVEKFAHEKKTCPGLV